MKKKEQEQYIMNYLSSNGGSMTRTKLGQCLIANGVVYNEAELYKLIQALSDKGYVELSKDDDVLLIKQKENKPLMEDIYLNNKSKVKGAVELSPNAMNQNPPMPL